MNRGAILVLKNYFFVSAFYADGAGAHRMPRRIARLRRPRPLPPPPFVCSVICANRWTRVLIHSLCSSLDDFSFGFSIFSTFFFKKIISSSSLEHPLLHLHPLPHSTAGRRPIPTQEKKNKRETLDIFMSFYVSRFFPLFLFISFVGRACPHCASSASDQTQPIKKRLRFCWPSVKLGKIP